MTDRERTIFATSCAVIAALLVVAGLLLIPVSSIVGYAVAGLGAIGAIQAVLVGLGLVRYGESVRGRETRDDE